MKHTPAPWQTSLTDDTVVIHIGADGVHYEVATIDGDYNEPDLWPVMEANARLIAAAPDLLAALQEAADTILSVNLNDRMCCSGQDCGCQGSTHGEFLLHNIRAAIARATTQGD